MSDFVWLPVIGHEKDYSVSNQGQVRRDSRKKGAVVGRILMPYRNKLGYLYHSVGGRMRSIHSVVADAFLGPRPAGTEINHKNGNPSDNRPENLEYITHSENAKHAFGVLKRPHARGQSIWTSKLSERDVIDIRLQHASGKSQASLSRQYSISERQMWNIVHRHSWKHV